LLVPADPLKPYDIKDAIHSVMDDGYFFEVHEHFAKNLVVGIARMDGRSVGIVANQPAFLAGVLDIKRVREGRAVVRFCDAFKHSVDHIRRVPDFFRNAAGIWRDYSSRCKVAVRVCGSDRSEDLR